MKNLTNFRKTVETSVDPCLMWPCICLAWSLNVVKREKVAHELQASVPLMFFHPSVCIPIDYGQ